ncbi:MAG: chemotaxis protein CheR [Gammaproteobacteria bacterium]|nr:MAG: chemotaxis protein CheR [Gammaproteobacteria bacterium]
MAYKRNDNSLLCDKDFKFVCDFVYQRAGIVLADNKREMVYRRFTRIMRERKLNSFHEYCKLLKDNPQQEENYFINAITTNLTSFFREQHHFDYLKEHEIPKLLKTNEHNKRIRIWSCASSTGEEPYSLAMTIIEAMQAQLSSWDVKILATDIDSNVLATCSAGIYEAKKLGDMEGQYKRKYFHKGASEHNQNQYKVDKKLAQLLTFKKLNLLHNWPMKGPFDVIFCRNVIIYFDKKTQHELFERYYQMLKPGGLLMLGHSENLGDYQQFFENVGRTIFRKPEFTNSQLNDFADDIIVKNTAGSL